MNKPTIASLIKTLQQKRTRVVTEYDAKEILRQSGFPVPECLLVDSADKAAGAAEQVGFPVVLKVHSTAITHKSDMGGVKLNLNSIGEVVEAYRQIAEKCLPLDPEMKVVVQPMVPAGIEAILGVSQDPQFGPVIMFGLGGIFTELFNDVAFRLLPVTLEDASQMVKSIRGVRLLEGYRGKPGGDIKLLADQIVSLSNLIENHPEIREIDLNPVMVYPHGAAVIDARMVLAE